MEKAFDPDAVIARKAASRAADAAAIASGRASPEEVNSRNGLAQAFDMRRSRVRLRAEME